MLGELIKKEILQHLMSLRFAIACVLCFITIFCGLFVQCQQYNLAYQDYNRANSFAVDELEKMRLPLGIIHNGFVVHQNPNPLKIFVRGLSNDFGHTVRVRQRNMPAIITSSSSLTSVGIFPAMDLITFVGLVMSLMAVIFGYDAICGEKERGTLRLMLSYSISRDRVLLGKWIGGYITLVIPFVLAMVSGAIIVLIQPDISLNMGEWTRLMGVSLLSLLFIAVIYSAAIWVSTLTSRSSTSILVLVALWMIFVLAIPNLSPHIAQFIQPVQDSSKASEDQRTAVSKIWREAVNDKMDEYDEIHGFKGQWWRSINWDEWNSRKPADERNVRQMELEREGYALTLRELDKYDQKLNNEIDSQSALCNWIARISPFSTFAISAAELTDNGVEGKRHFVNQTKKYQLEIYDYAYAEQLAMYDYYIEHDGEWEGMWRDTRKNPIPRFTYTPRATVDCFKTIALDSAILVSLGFIFFLLSYYTFMFYDVR